MNEKTFKKRLQFGRTGERAIIRYLLSRPGTCYVTNASVRMDLQRRGIDMIWGQKNAYGKCVDMAVEIKTSHYQPSYFKVQVLKNVVTQELGWFYTSQAHYFFFVSPTMDTMYLVPIDLLRNWVESRKSQFGRKRWPITNDRGLRTGETEIMYIPIEQAMRDLPAIDKVQGYSAGTSFVSRMFAGKNTHNEFVLIGIVLAVIIFLVFAVHMVAAI